MLVLKIVLLLVGVLFTAFGCAIFFFGKYSLINGFEEARRAGRRTERYARCVGLAELILGISLLIAALLLILFA